jgi:hypothetical protein
MAEHPIERPEPAEFLRPDIRNRLVRLLTGEIAAACEAALAAGVRPEELVEFVRRRRRAIRLEPTAEDGPGTTTADGGR